MKDFKKTAVDDEVDKVIAFNAGTYNYLSKPFLVKEIITGINVIYKRIFF